MVERSRPRPTLSGFWKPSRVYMAMSAARRRNVFRLRSPWLKPRVNSAAFGFRAKGSAGTPCLRALVEAAALRIEAMQPVRVSGRHDEGNEALVVPRPDHGEVDEVAADLPRQRTRSPGRI